MEALVRDDLIHATCIARDGVAVLLIGRSGTGKSDLALRLIDRGWRLVSDDYTQLSVAPDGRLIGQAPETIAGRIEVRGFGIVSVDALPQAPVALAFDLERAVERMPDRQLTHRLLAVDVPIMPLAALEPSAPIKVEIMLRAVLDGVTA